MSDRGWVLAVNGECVPCWRESCGGMLHAGAACAVTSKVRVTATCPRCGGAMGRPEAREAADEVTAALTQGVA